MSTNKRKRREGTKRKINHMKLSRTLEREAERYVDPDARLLKIDPSKGTPATDI